MEAPKSPVVEKNSCVKKSTGQSATNQRTATTTTTATVPTHGDEDYSSIPLPWDLIPTYSTNLGNLQNIQINIQSLQNELTELKAMVLNGKTHRPIRASNVTTSPTAPKTSRKATLASVDAKVDVIMSLLISEKNT